MVMIGRPLDREALMAKGREDLVTLKEKMRATEGIQGMDLETRVALMYSERIYQALRERRDLRRLGE